MTQLFGFLPKLPSIHKWVFFVYSLTFIFLHSAKNAELDFCLNFELLLQQIVFFFSKKVVPLVIMSNKCCSRLMLVTVVEKLIPRLKRELVVALLIL